MLISLEGIDGSGKSTQALKLKGFLERKGLKVKLYREPGGTPVSEDIRNLLIKYKLTPLGELFLFEASRAELVKEIRKHLEKEYTVIMDRFTDSTLAYQGYGRGLDKELIKQLNRIVAEGLIPDITFLLDIEPDLALNRLKKRTHFEDIRFLHRVRKGYLKIAQENPDRIVVVPANGTEEEVFHKIVKFLKF